MLKLSQHPKSFSLFHFQTIEEDTCKIFPPYNLPNISNLIFPFLHYRCLKSNQRLPDRAPLRIQLKDSEEPQGRNNLPASSTLRWRSTEITVDRRQGGAQGDPHHAGQKGFRLVPSIFPASCSTGDKKAERQKPVNHSPCWMLPTLSFLGSCRCSGARCPLLSRVTHT